MFFVPTTDTSVEISYVDPDTSYDQDLYMNLVFREIGMSTTEPYGYDLVGDSPAYPDGYTFEEKDLIMYSSLLVSDEPIYNGAG